MITPEEVAEDLRLQREAELAEQDRIVADAERESDWTGYLAGSRELLDEDTTSPIAWVPGCERIIRRGERQSWIAGYGEGKTMAAIMLAAQVCQDGGHVVYLDVENDPREMAERLKPVVASFGDCGTRERLAYRTTADAFTDPERAAELVAALATADLLIVDSLTRVLAAADIDENVNSEVAKFTADIVDVIAQEHDTATIILDNTGKDADRGARGAVSKAALVEAVYSVTGGKDIAEDRHGTLTLKLTRSRSGKLAKVVTAGAGGGDYSRLTVQEGEPGTGGDERLVSDRVVLATMAAAPGCSSHGVTASRFAPTAKVSPATAKRRLAALVTAGMAEVTTGGRLAANAEKFYRPLTPD